ncbi:MAG: carbonic anhydrase [Paludibacteraceae bacterium]
MTKKESKLKRLFDGVKAFGKSDFPRQKAHFKKLEREQNPHTLFIGCSDSRVVPNLITRTMPGELFIIRNVANLVPYFNQNHDNYLATSSAIEYAVNVLEVENIIICGHSNCGGCRTIYEDESKMHDLPLVRKWLELAYPVKEQVRQKILSNRSVTYKRDELTAQLNVVEQMKHLLTFPYVKERYDSGKLNILGWYYVIETGKVYNYSRSTGTFEKIK